MGRPGPRPGAPRACRPCWPSNSGLTGGRGGGRPTAIETQWGQNLEETGAKSTRSSTLLSPRRLPRPDQLRGRRSRDRIRPAHTTEGFARAVCIEPAPPILLPANSARDATAPYRAGKYLLARYGFGSTITIPEHTSRTAFALDHRLSESALLDQLNSALQARGTKCRLNDRNKTSNASWSARRKERLHRQPRKPLSKPTRPQNKVTQFPA